MWKSAHKIATFNWYPKINTTKIRWRVLHWWISFAFFLLEYPVLNICLVEEKNYLFFNWLQKFQNKTWTIAWTTDSWFSLSEFHSSYEYNSKLWIREETNNFDISIFCTHTCNTDIIIVTTKFLTIEIIMVSVWSLIPTK